MIFFSTVWMVGVGFRSDALLFGWISTHTTNFLDYVQGGWAKRFNEKSYGELFVIPPERCQRDHSLFEILFRMSSNGVDTDPEVWNEGKADFFFFFRKLYFSELFFLMRAIQTLFQFFLLLKYVLKSICWFYWSFLYNPDHQI